MFSFSKRQLIYNVEWESSSRKDMEAGYVYATRFSKPNPHMILAGGAGKNEVRIFENNVDGSATFRFIGGVNELPTPCLSLETSKTGDNFAFGC